MLLCVYNTAKNLVITNTASAEIVEASRALVVKVAFNLWNNVKDAADAIYAGGAEMTKKFIKPQGFNSCRRQFIQTGAPPVILSGAQRSRRILRLPSSEGGRISGMVADHSLPTTLWNGAANLRQPIISLSSARLVNRVH